MSIAALKKAPLFACLLALLFAAGCASRSADEEGETYDPWEGFNRQTFTLNQSIDTLVVRPIAVTYRDIVPPGIKTMVENFLDFIHTPVRLANDLLQGDLKNADITAQRFAQNMVTLGFGDPASNIPSLPAHDSDFGLTLARWGASEGPYIVIPVIGPSNLRDGVGMGIDLLMDPITWWARGKEREFGYGDMSIRIIDARASSLKDLDQIQAQSLDFYASLRSLYTQYRAGQLRKLQPGQSGEGPGFYQLMSPAMLADPNATKTSSVLAP
jgi:phospholipid-binding lipoprotein MlaA